MTAPIPDTEERPAVEQLIAELVGVESSLDQARERLRRALALGPLAATTPQADRGLTVRPITPTTSNGPLDPPPNDANFAARRDTPPAGLDVEHGRCCNCFDAPNMAAGHEHWGDEL